MAFVRSDAQGLLGQDAKILEIRGLIELMAAVEAPVLITGESGTGKEIVARELHARSARRRGPYVCVNCGAIAPMLEESELFGHVAGAFTGAVGRKRGKLEVADGGTLFLDEVGEMSPALQVKLLRALQTGEVAPVGMAETRMVDVRVIAATNQDLERCIREGTFRRDLYYRLNVLRLEMPPLRERPGDLLLLARHFVRRYAAAYQRPEPEMEPEFQEALLGYDFPGNVRELENVIHRAVVLGREGRLGTRLLPAELRQRGATAAVPGNFHEAKQLAVEQFERDYLTATLRECGGIVSRAARRSGLSERNFHEKLSRYGIDGQSFRADTGPDPAP